MAAPQAPWVQLQPPCTALAVRGDFVLCWALSWLGLWQCSTLGLKRQGVLCLTRQEPLWQSH